MTSGHGGARPGAGRPRNQDKYTEQTVSFHDQAAQDLPDRYAALQILADGGYTEEDVEEVWEPAGLVQITKELITEDGRSVNVRELAFPHLPPDQLVCVQRKVKKRVAAPDRLANQYLVDRVAGKPVATVDLNSDPDGTLEVTTAALEQATQELVQWRERMTTQLSSLNAPPTLPTSSTPTV